MVNGVFVPGGNYPLALHTRWFTTLQLLFDLTVEANDAGQHVPVSPPTARPTTCQRVTVSRHGNITWYRRLSTFELLPPPPLLFTAPCVMCHVSCVCLCVVQLSYTVI